jgi:hypothetical protein
VSDFISNQTAEVERQFKVFSRLTDQRITDLRRETEEKLEELHDAADLLYADNQKLRGQLKLSYFLFFFLIILICAIEVLASIVF